MTNNKLQTLYETNRQIQMGYSVKSEELNKLWNYYNNNYFELTLLKFAKILNGKLEICFKFYPVKEEIERIMFTKTFYGIDFIIEDLKNEN